MQALHRDGIAIGELALVPVRVNGLRGAGSVEFGDLFHREAPSDRAKILAELLFVARTHDDVYHGRALQEPVQGNLRNGLAGFLRDFLDGIDDFVEMFVFDLRAEVRGFVEARNCGEGAVAADLTGEASPTERTPDERADFLIEGERHQFPFVFACDQRVVDLMAGVARPAVSLGNRERLHEMPSGKIGARDITDFSGFDESVEGRQSFFDRREGVEPVHVIDVDVVDGEAPETVLAGSNEVMARGADIVGAFPHGEGSFGRDQHAAAFASDGLAEDFFGQTIRVYVGGVKEIDVGVEADVDEARSFGDVTGAPGFEEFGAAAKRAGTEAEDGNLKTGMAELSEFHGGLDATRNQEDTGTMPEAAGDLLLRQARELKVER
jgi:hypothetical protein